MRPTHMAWCRLDGGICGWGFRSLLAQVWSVVLSLLSFSLTLIEMWFLVICVSVGKITVVV